MHDDPVASALAWRFCVGPRPLDECILCALDISHDDHETTVPGTVGQARAAVEMGSDETVIGVGLPLGATLDDLTDLVVWCRSRFVVAQTYAINGTVVALLAAQRRAVLEVVR